MAQPNFQNRTLYHGDNLEFLRGMNSETVHLIATDPPFKKGKDFHATPDSLARGASFKDRWRWDKDVHEEWTDSIIDDWPDVWEVITAARAAYGDDMGAFLCWLGVRVMEMHRVLRRDGSFYLHMDQTAHAWVKCMLDAVFGSKMFRGAITWERNDGRGKGSQHSPKTWGTQTDILLYYTKTDDYRLFPYIPLTAVEEKDEFPLVDRNGRRYKTGIPIFRAPSMGARPNLCFEWRGFRNPHSSGWRLSRERLEEEYQLGNIVIRSDGKLERRKYTDDYVGRPVGDLWKGIHPAKGSERTGYPTQKPLALYRRIIEASSDKGDFVLDPFCGCATTPVAAEQLKRQWVGMDIWDGARDEVLRRLQDDWLFTQEGAASADVQPMFPHTVHYETTTPERSDENEVAAPTLKLRIQRPVEPWQKISHSSMMNVLAAAQGSGGDVICAGCGRVLEREFMQLDHITPKADRGTNDILNRILLCGPCNRRKRDTLTLRGLLQENKKKAVGWMQDEGRAKLAQDSARDKAEWVRDDFDSPECQALLDGRSSPF